MLRSCQAIDGCSGHSPPPANNRAIDTSTTAPSVAAARLYMNPLRRMPSCEKIQPPSTAPTSPSRTFAMQPNPRPRETFPASHPAIRPTNIHPMRVLGTVKKNKCMERSFSRGRRADSASGLSGLLLRHTVYCAQAENKVKTRDSYNFAPRKQSGEFSEGQSVIRIVKRRRQDDLIRNIKIRVARGKPLPI